MSYIINNTPALTGQMFFFPSCSYLQHFGRWGGKKCRYQMLPPPHRSTWGRRPLSEESFIDWLKSQEECSTIQKCKNRIWCNDAACLCWHAMLLVAQYGVMWLCTDVPLYRRGCEENRKELHFKCPPTLRMPLRGGAHVGPFFFSIRRRFTLWYVSKMGIVGWIHMFSPSKHRSWYRNQFHTGRVGVFLFRAFSLYLFVTFRASTSSVL